MESSKADPKRQGRLSKNTQHTHSKIKEKELQTEYDQKNSYQSNKTLKLIVNVDLPLIAEHSRAATSDPKR